MWWVGIWVWSDGGMTDMATGSNLGSLIPIAMTAFGLVAMFSRKRKPKEPTEADRELEERQAATAETKRRMAAYLASRDSGSDHSATLDWTHKENDR